MDKTVKKGGKQDKSAHDGTPLFYGVKNWYKNHRKLGSQKGRAGLCHLHSVKTGKLFQTRYRRA